jgi:hypothetical protein
MAAKTPLASPRRSAPESIAEAVRGADPSPRQERLLGEISHELGNYFHKLYYWAELLREQRPAAAEPEPAVLLERTIRDLETFLKTALEFFRPISIVPLVMPVDELTKSLRTLVTRYVAPTSVRWELEAAPAVGGIAVDPGRFSFVVEGMVRRLDAVQASDVTATIRGEGAGKSACYAFTLTGHGAERPSPGVSAVIEWAVIERIVELHGGTVETSAAGAERVVRLSLPVQA